jgi:poly-gamma-glutamate capsule biosynthesis protein CapA/YwtB (metallophosphatase superfamily)
MNIGNVSTAATIQQATAAKPAQRQQTSAASATKTAANLVSTATQEALETSAQTKNEARSGDQQAARKLAHDGSAQTSQAAAQSGIGRRVNTKA